jgi:hypothetical protein
MEPEETLAVAFLVCEYLKGNVNRKWWWVHPIDAVRHHDGHFYTLYTSLRKDPTKLFNYFTMKANTFDDLLSGVQDYFKKSDTDMMAEIKPEDMLETLDE